MKELIEQVPHTKATEDFDREHDAATCLRCQMDDKWSTTKILIEGSISELVQHNIHEDYWTQPESLEELRKCIAG